MASSSILSTIFNSGIHSSPSSSSSSPNVKSHLAERFHTTPPSNMISFSGKRRMALVVIKCSSNETNGAGNPNLRDLLTGIVDEQVEQLLSLQGLEKATERVESAKIELAQIERQEAEAKLLRDYVNQLQSTTSEIAECQKEISEAKAMVEEAYRSLEGVGLSGDSLAETRTESINTVEERLESVKAASVSAVVGTLAWLPLSLTRGTTSISELIVPLAITFVSSALFGVTFRYALRRDLDNFHLKSGTSAAFGIVKGLGTLGARQPLQLDDIRSLFPIALDGAVCVSENLLVFFFAGIALDFCMKLGILSPFPADTTKSNDDNI